MLHQTFSNHGLIDGVVPPEELPAIVERALAVLTAPAPGPVPDPLADTGLPDTPEKIYLPAIAALGRRPDEVRWVILTHADADHIGGNSVVRRHFPHAAIACHELDKRWVV